MKMPLYLGACACLLAAFAGGCRLLNDEPVVQGHSPLQPARPSPDSVTMEIIWARFPAGDPAINSDAWREIDETQLPPAVQRALANNGLRAGFARFAGAFTLLLHLPLEAGVIDGDTVGAQDIFRHVERKAVGVVELESHLPE